MTKFGRLAPTEAQTCYTHGLHLAVCDVLYTKQVGNSTAPDAGLSSDDMTDLSANSDTDVSDESDDDHDERSAIHLGAAEVEFKYDGDGVPELDLKWCEVISKFRKECRTFRKSALKSEILQEYVKKEHGKELKPLLDVKVRWNSMEAMLSRFVHTHPCLCKFYVDLKMTSD